MATRLNIEHERLWVSRVQKCAHLTQSFETVSPVNNREAGSYLIRFGLQNCAWQSILNGWLVLKETQNDAPHSSGATVLGSPV